MSVPRATYIDQRRIASILLLPLTIVLSPALAGETISIYRLAGTMQCSDRPGQSPDAAAEALREQGVEVLSAARRRLPVRMPQRCQTPTGDANVLLVPAPDWQRFIDRVPDRAGFGRWLFDDGQLEVFQHDGSLRCEMGEAIDLEAMARSLTRAGISVYKRRKGSDGRRHIGVCGAATGAVNVYRIDARALEEALGLGFELLMTGPLGQRIKPAINRRGTIQSRGIGLERAAQRSRLPDLW